MQNKFKIIKSEFIDFGYEKNPKYIHWSRIYEWNYVIDKITELKPKTIHNTACGGLNINDCLHLTFCDDVENLCEDVIHSDLWGGSYPGTQTKPNKENFVFYDITTPFDKKFDMVLNISTIEHLPNEYRILALQNLVDQINIGGHLILTFDYPDIDILEIENFFGVEIKNSSESIKNQHLSVVLLHLIKLQ
jgi:hypothetical protein